MYLLHHNPACGPKCPVGKFPTLAEAMAVASRSPAYLGGGAPTDWNTAVNIPGKLFLDAAAYVDPDDDSDEIPPPLWIIEAPGVARELAGLMTTGQLDSRSWSTSDPYFLAATAEMLPHLEAWCAPAAAAGIMHATGVRLAAWYATSDAPPLDPLFLRGPEISQIITTAAAEAGATLAGSQVGTLTAAVAARLAFHGIPIVPTLPPRGPESEATPMPYKVRHPAAGGQPGPGKPAYWLWRGDEEYTGAGWGRPAGCFASLDDAMDATGHMVNANWHTAAGLPGLLFLTDPASREDGPFEVLLWTIEAPGVAREFADRCSPELRAARHWSPFDQRIIAATMNATCPGDATTWPLAPWLAIDAGVRLAAWYATGGDVVGSLSTVDVHTVIGGAYSAAYPDRDVPVAVIDQIAATLVRRLCEAGADIIGGKAAMLPRPRPGTTVTVVDLRAPGARPYRGHPFDGVNIVAWRGWDRLGGLEERFWAWWRRPVWTVPIPAGRLSARLCRALSDLISGLVIGSCMGSALYATWYLAHGPATSGWASLWDLSNWVAWWDGAVQTGKWPLAVALLLGWYLAGCLAGKLIRLELHPAQRETAGTS